MPKITQRVRGSQTRLRPSAKPILCGLQELEYPRLRGRRTPAFSFSRLHSYTCSADVPEGLRGPVLHRWGLFSKVTARMLCCQRRDDVLARPHPGGSFVHRPEACLWGRLHGASQTPVQGQVEPDSSLRYQETHAHHKLENTADKFALQHMVA